MALADSLRGAGNAVRGISIIFVVQLLSWWFFSSHYSIEVKKFLKDPLPLHATFVSLLLSTVCSVAFLKRSDTTITEKLSSYNTYRQLFLVSFLHLMGTASTVYSVSRMAVSFTHVVKAAEPVFTIGWTFFVGYLQSTAVEPLSRQRLLAVFTVVAGVIMSSISESTFSWPGLMWGLLSNLSFSGRNVLSKSFMSREKMSKDMLYLIMNINAIVFVTLPMLILEGGNLFEGNTYSLFSSSVSYYLYTAISMNILEGVSAVSHAIANTCKRLILVITSCIVFGCSPSPWSAFGAYITIGGVAFYSIISAQKPSSTSLEEEKSYKKHLFVFCLVGLLFLAPSAMSVSTPQETAAPAQRATVVPRSNAPMIVEIQQNFTNPIKHLFEGVEEVIIMDFPNYPNRGDSALYMGEIEFFHSLGIPVVYECTVEGYDWERCSIDYVKSVLDPRTGVICFNGGGSFGDIWPKLRIGREYWLVQLHEYRVIQLPQTVHFKNLDTARKSAEIWAAHPRATITVRDLHSVSFLHEFYPTTPVYLIPDAAFMLGPRKRQAPSMDMFWLLRTDKETKLDSNPDARKQVVANLLPQSRSNVTLDVGDWLDYDAPNLPYQGKGQLILRRRAMRRTDDAIRILSLGKVLVSDRLHSHIIATLLDVPHVLLDNENGKVFDVHNTWTKQAAHIRLAVNLQDAMVKALELLDEYNARGG